MPNVKKAIAAGIPVVVLNGGLDTWKQQRARSGYFGQDERIAGQATGDKLKPSSAPRRSICVIHEQGHVSLEARCQGVKDKFGDVENVNVTGTDQPGSQATMTSKLQQDKTIDYVVTLDAPFALTAVKSVKDAGSAAKVGTFDMSKEMVEGDQGRHACSSPSTSSRTCRATWRSTRSGSTRPTATPSAAARPR